MNTTGFNRWLFRKGQPPVQYLDTLIRDIPGHKEEGAMVASLRPNADVLWYVGRQYSWVVKGTSVEVPGEYLIQLLLIK
ncbi:MAG TPA: hypothetical protein VM783_07785 [Candidatus Acidoferrum sp.]|nr:hypothetical protein [Candidatus Acidoferrum sp.]